MERSGEPLTRSFYLQEDVIAVAKQLLGKLLITRYDGVSTGGIITETEAYAGVGDRASHAHGGRRTRRNEIMYAGGGHAYVYLCYGIHHLFNVVTHREGIPHAVLIRAIHPVIGVNVMRARRSPQRFTTAGPGTLTQALGLTVEQNGIDLLSGPISINDIGLRIAEADLLIGPRIGVAYAGADALLPFRFRIAPSRLATWTDQ